MLIHSLNSNHNKTAPGTMHNSTGHQIPDSTNPLATKHSAIASSIQFWRRCLDFEDHQARRLVMMLRPLYKAFCDQLKLSSHLASIAPSHGYLAIHYGKDYLGSTTALTTR